MVPDTPTAEAMSIGPTWLVKIIPVQNAVLHTEKMKPGKTKQASIEKEKMNYKCWLCVPHHDFVHSILHLSITGSLHSIVKKCTSFSNKKEDEEKKQYFLNNLICLFFYCDIVVTKHIGCFEYST